MIKILSPDRAYQSFNEGMRQRNIWHGVHFCHLKNPKIGFPSMKHEQWIIVGTQIPWTFIAANDAVEHAANCGSVEYPRMHRKANDSPRILVHEDHHPMGLEDHGFTSKEIHAPQAVFVVAQESEPGRTV
ncbi:MAG: hypothetical protein WD795_08890 [Woeseia sp.]